MPFHVPFWALLLCMKNLVISIFFLQEILVDIFKSSPARLLFIIHSLKNVLVWDFLWDFWEKQIDFAATVFLLLKHIPILNLRSDKLVLLYEPHSRCHFFHFYWRFERFIIIIKEFQRHPSLIFKLFGNVKKQCFSLDKRKKSSMQWINSFSTLEDVILTWSSINSVFIVFSFTLKLPACCLVNAELLFTTENTQHFLHKFTWWFFMFRL